MEQLNDLAQPSSRAVEPVRTRLTTSQFRSSCARGCYVYVMTSKATGDQGSAPFEHFQHLSPPPRAGLDGGKGTRDHLGSCREVSEVQVQEER